MADFYTDLMRGGDIGDTDSDMNWAPDIYCQYNVCWQSNGKTFIEDFTVFEGDDERKVFAKACAFAKEHDTLVFYCVPCTIFINPKTGEEIDEPLNCGKDYYTQPPSPKQRLMFTAIETDELPF